MGDVAARVLDAVESAAAALLDEAAELVRVPSVSGSDAENDAQQLLADRLDRTGYDVDHWRLDLDALTAHPDFPGMEVNRREAWGLVGRLPGSGDGPTLMLNGHVDVVPTGDGAAWALPPFGAVRRDGRLYGRGACDMKGGLIAAIGAVDALRSAGVRLRGDVVVAAVQGEEDGGLGTFALLQRGWRADACVIAEPTDLAVIPANSGALTFRLRVRGRATHAARRNDGVSAIEKFWPVWDALQRFEANRHRSVDPLMQRWPLAHPLSIGSLTAGDWASSVPDLLVAEGRIGVALDEPVERRHAPRCKQRSTRSTTQIRGSATIPSNWSGGAASSPPADSRPAATSSHASKQPTSRGAAPAPNPRRSTAPRTAVTCDCSPDSAASRPCSTGPATPGSPTGRTSRSRSPTSSPRRARSPCSRSTSAAPEPGPPPVGDR